MTYVPEALSASTSIDEISKSPRSRMRKMTTLSLIGATFFMVSGGPFGLEELRGDRVLVVDRAGAQLGVPGRELALAGGSDGSLR